MQSDYPSLGYGDSKPTDAELDLNQRAQESIPGGCHTAAKGNDQYPERAPMFIERGSGSHIWDTEGREYIEYGMGLRSVTLGHALPRITEAVYKAIQHGNNFNRPSRLEVECAEHFLDMIPTADMVKFTKDGSTVLTAAVKLARAHTGRNLVALCKDSPFFSYDDWFIGTTTINSGIPESVKALTLRFDYNNLASLESLLDEYDGQICSVVMEPARTTEPAPGFLEGVQTLCRRHGVVLIYDETLTGFRWHNGAAQHVYGVVPDLACFGKAMANGFAISALAGKKELMELGGLQHKRERVFLLSTTHGAESPALAAAMETMSIYREEPVIEHLHAAGERLRAGIEPVAESLGLSDYFKLFGRGCFLMFATLDNQLQPSQPMRTLFLQEILRRGILAPSLIPSYSHTDDDLDHTINAVSEALAIYKAALDNGHEDYLIGPPSSSSYRKFN